MKLLGIEFREFACFTRQWLPLQPGINVLVGKNNHGKTALLRGLATLPLLPIPSSLPCKVPASQYARDQRSYFDLTVVFELDASDLDKRAPLFVPLIEDRERMLSGHPPLLKYGYRISAAHNAASFVNCILRVEDREIDVLAPTP